MRACVHALVSISVRVCVCVGVCVCGSGIFEAQLSIRAGFMTEDHFVAKFALAVFRSLLDLLRTDCCPLGPD